MIGPALCAAAAGRLRRLVRYPGLRRGHNRRASVVLVVVAASAVIALLLPALAYAAPGDNVPPSNASQGNGSACQTKGIPILPSWYKYLGGKTDAAGYCNVQFAFPEDIGLVLLAIFEILLRIAAYVAIGYIIYGGINYIISQGEPDKVGGAKQTILNAIIGLIVAMLATAVVNFVGGRFIIG